MKRALSFIAAAVALCGCTGNGGSVVEGRVESATAKTVTVCTEAGETITFITANAVRDCKGGLFAGSPIRVEYGGQPDGGFAAAVRIVAPAEYNMLVGAWVKPNPLNEAETEGFELYAGGAAESLGMRTLLYESWSTDGKRLILSGRSLGNGTTIGFTEEWTIERLDSERLVLRSDDATHTYAKTTYPQR